jgi:hypothetical protein
MIEINQLSLAYFRRHLPSSWGQHYLAERFGVDISNDPRFQQVTHPPAGPTSSTISGVSGSATTK